jgi:hypothetical protein
MRIGEANRLYKDNLSAVIESETGDANFASARACWDRLTVQYPVDPFLSAETGDARVSGSAGYGIPANCSGEHQRKRADVVGPDARKVV